MVIRHIGALSCGKLMGALYAIVGLIIGAVFALISLAGMGMAASSDHAMPGMLGAFVGAGAIILFPLMYGVLGFVGGLIGAVIYNFVAGLVGGIEVDIQ